MSDSSGGVRWEKDRTRLRGAIITWPGRMDVQGRKEKDRGRDVMRREGLMDRVANIMEVIL